MCPRSDDSGLVYSSEHGRICRYCGLASKRCVCRKNPRTKVAPVEGDGPLVGALFTFLVILISGVIVRHLFGHEIVRFGERLLSRVPVARSIYGGVKQLFEAIVTSNSGASFNRVVIIEYPRKGLFALAFTTGPARGSIQEAMPDTPLVNCFVP